MRFRLRSFYSHVNYSVTKICSTNKHTSTGFYSHVNYSVTKIVYEYDLTLLEFYSHVNYSVTKMLPYFFRKGG